jgi:hypothetical protein
MEALIISENNVYFSNRDFTDAIVVSKSERFLDDGSIRNISNYLMDEFEPNFFVFHSEPQDYGY